MSYDFNKEAERIAERYIERYHQHLRKTKIAYLYKGEETDKVPEPTQPGKSITYAKAFMIPDKYRLLASEDYVFGIEFTQPIWHRLELPSQEALVDHELCHCRINDLGEPYLADHDVEEFQAILRRHGFWRVGLQRFIEAATPLFDQPGFQPNLAAPAKAVPAAVAYGEPVRLLETGEQWSFNPKVRRWIPIVPDDAHVRCINGCDAVLIPLNNVDEMVASGFFSDPAAFFEATPQFPVWGCAICSKSFTVDIVASALSLQRMQEAHR
jgi:hypothetical protein